MRREQKSALLTGLVIGSFAVLAIGLLTFSNPKERQDNSLLPVSTDAFGGDYTLTSHTGEKVSSDSFNGQYQLLYFGFTFCPAICPTELTKITDVLNTLPPEKAEQINPIFITVDPERDTTEVMKDYVSLFHPRMTGLTGSVDEINAVKKLYKVYAAKVDDPNMTEYTVDHSSYIYFMDPDGALLNLFKIDDSKEELLNTVSRWMDKQAGS